MTDSGEITRLLRRLEDERGPDRSAVVEQLVPLIYGELKKLAHANRFRWSDDRAPGTTSLVHEAYLKLARPDLGSFANRRQFFALASRAMRSILVDNARWAGRQKRGGGSARTALEESMLVSAERSEDLLVLNDALDRLDERDPRLARIVECRCFGGLSVDETAETLAISPATVKRGWRLARAWLFRALQPASS